MASEHKPSAPDRGRPRKPPVAPLPIGWREWIALPDLGIGPMKVKIDTGARSAALHAIDIETFVRDGADWVGFTVPASVGEHDSCHLCYAPIRDMRMVKNTSGIAEQRIVIHTRILLGRRHWTIDVTLANRDNMGFRMLLGRASLRRRNVTIHPGRSFLQGLPQAD